jgi:hypothetical protein
MMPFVPFWSAPIVGQLLFIGALLGYGGEHPGEPPDYTFELSIGHEYGPAGCVGAVGLVQRGLRTQGWESAPMYPEICRPTVVLDAADFFRLQAYLRKHPRAPQLTLRPDEDE